MTPREKIAKAGLEASVAAYQRPDGAPLDAGFMASAVEALRIVRGQIGDHAVCVDEALEFINDLLSDLQGVEQEKKDDQAVDQPNAGGAADGPGDKRT